LGRQSITALCLLIPIMLGQDPQFLSPAFSYETDGQSIGNTAVKILGVDLNRVWVQFAHMDIYGERMMIWFHGPSRINYEMSLDVGERLTLKYSDVGTICGGEFYARTWESSSTNYVPIGWATQSFYPHRLTDE